jgi:peptide deformylase
VELTLVPNAVLARKMKPLKAADLKAGTYAVLIAAMKKDMVEHNGIGLAANQVGKDLALFVIDEKLAAEYEVPSVYANPSITEYGKETDDVEEGCLSIPGMWVHIKRSKKVMFKALDGEGNRVKFRARGMLARVLQHETDHLNGTTIKDRSHE